MDKPISVGDLVVVVKGSPCVCKGDNARLGVIFRVAELAMSQSRYCVSCNRKKPNAFVAFPDGIENRIYTLDRLKRIPPLDELEGRIEWQRIEDLA